MTFGVCSRPLGIVDVISGVATVAAPVCLSLWSSIGRAWKAGPEGQKRRGVFFYVFCAEKSDCCFTQSSFFTPQDSSRTIFYSLYHTEKKPRANAETPTALQFSTAGSCATERHASIGTSVWAYPILRR